MRKGYTFIWDQSCQEVFEEIKNYLMRPLVLAVLVAEKPFQLYIWAMHYSLRALLAQHTYARKEKAIYYMSRTMMGMKSQYNPIEKECLIGVRHIKDATLPSGPNSSRHIQGQSPVVAHDQTIRSEWTLG